MSEARFTLGPWRIAAHETKTRGIDIVKADTIVANVWLPRFVDQSRPRADAALIAAAPDLYSALEFAVRELRLVRDGSLHGTPNSVFALIPEAIEKADAALSPARGE